MRDTYSHVQPTACSLWPSHAHKQAITTERIQHARECNHSRKGKPANHPTVIAQILGLL